MLADFIKDGTIKVKKSCTENSQTFHVPSRICEGSPVKAESLPTRKRPCFDDPRPPSFRNREGYQDRVRNLVFNFCGTTGEDLTMRYLYEKADLTTAVHDHDYLQLPFTEYWVDRLFQITECKAVALKRRTREQSSCKLWHEARQWRLTSSRFGDIIKMTERRNKEKLCHSICHPPNLTCPAVIHGLKFETMARKKFEVKTGHKVEKSGFFVRPEYNFFGY